MTIGNPVLPFRPFACPNCGGQVTERMAPGRTAEFWRGAPEMPIPADFPLPTCERCGETYTQPGQEAALTTILEGEFRKWQVQHLSSLVGHLMGFHDVTQAKVAGAACMTISSLKEAIAGKVLIAMAHMRLIEAFAACPAEFRRHLRGEVFDLGRTP